MRKGALLMGAWNSGPGRSTDWRSPDAEPYSSCDPFCGHGKYVKMHLLGRGSYGYVLLAREAETGELAAVKVIPRSAVSKYVESEVLNHSRLCHPHVVQFKEAFLTPSSVCIAMEYASGGTLFTYLQRAGRLHEPVARWFFQQLVVGIDYCHRMGVVNRDLKLENTLLHSVPHLPLPLVKICDFGCSKADITSAAKSKVGTLTYMAPEVLVTASSDAPYDGKSADVWSCGVMLFVMVTGRYPFGSFRSEDGSVAPPGEVLRVMERMVRCDLSVPSGVTLSPGLLDLLTKIFAPDPRARIRISEILEHPWFLSNLPPQAAAMNDRFVAAAAAGPPRGMQSPAEARAVITEARRRAAEARARAALAAAARATEAHAAGKDEATAAATRAAARRRLVPIGSCSGACDAPGSAAVCRSAPCAAAAATMPVLPLPVSITGLLHRQDS